MTDLPDYRVDPEAYEVKEHSRPDEMLMFARLWELANQLLDSMPAATVLDLCCGTGLSLERVVGHANLSEVVGVDICDPYLQYARRRFANAALRPTLLLGDAIDTELPQAHWDVILLSSAYHHIEDGRKRALWTRVRSLLRPHGRVVVAENMLPEYAVGDRTSYASAVRAFYAQVLEETKASNPELPGLVERVILQVAKNGQDGVYEYKTSYSVLVEHLTATGLEIVSEERVWPSGGPLTEGRAGNYVFVLRASSGP